VAYKCPRCGAPKTVRRDSFQPGLHQLTCRNCGFSSGDIQLKDNTVVEHDDTG
jgi:transcription elongation factor Elf1